MKKLDCNERMIKNVGKLAVEQALTDYRSGTMARDVFEQLGQVLWWMQREVNKPNGKKKCATKRK